MTTTPCVCTGGVVAASAVCGALHTLHTHTVGWRDEGGEREGMSDGVKWTERGEKERG